MGPRPRRLVLRGEASERRDQLERLRAGVELATDLASGLGERDPAILLRRASAAFT